jgi:hypothetical protein
VQNLRIAVLLNAKHPDFKAHLASSPALFSHTTVHWLDALTAAQQSGIVRTEAAPAFEASKDVKQQIAALVEALQAVHATAARRVDLTPQHFRALVRQTVAILVERRSALTEQIDFLQVSNNRVGLLYVAHVPKMS